MSNCGAGRRGEDAEHLEAVSDGAGCVEVWERLSARRAADDDAVQRERATTQEGR